MPGPYELHGLKDGTYTIYAFVDLDDDGAPRGNEPYGWYDQDGDDRADDVVVEGGASARGLAVTIAQP